jgi:metal-responsive CopG/Arc/MetJ family transcriptional regulator
MKTAISIPDSIFQAAETAARRLSMSRSELYAKAVQEFVAAHCRADVTEKLNQVYSEKTPGLDPALSRMQSLSLDDAPW